MRRIATQDAAYGGGIYSGVPLHLGSNFQVIELTVDVYAALKIILHKHHMMPLIVERLSRGEYVTDSGSSSYTADVNINGSVRTVVFGSDIKQRGIIALCIGL